MDDIIASRDERGRFLPGGAGGPGRPSVRTVDRLRQAVEEAVTPEHLTAVMRRLTRAALEGNIPAARIVLERSCGKPVESPPAGAPITFEMPRMRTAAECNAAVERIGEAVCRGDVDREAAKLMLDVIQTRLKAIEVTDFEQRLAELERTAKLVQL